MDNYSATYEVGTRISILVVKIRWLDECEIFD